MPSGDFRRAEAPRRKRRHQCILSRDERVALETPARQYTSPYCIVMGSERRLYCSRRRVCLTTSLLIASTRRARLSASGASDSPSRDFLAWSRKPRGGRPALFSPSVVVQVKALACELPHRLRPPLSRLSLSEIRREVISPGLVAEISGATLWRWLGADALRRPWRQRRGPAP
jgi:hypothetical protein